MHTHALIILKIFKYVKDISVPKLGICGTKLQLTHSGMCNGIAHPFFRLPALSYSRVSRLSSPFHNLHKILPIYIFKYYNKYLCIYRRSKLDWRNTSTRAKVMGTVISISGAFVEELYKGPFIRPASSSSPNRLLKSIPKLLVYYNLPDNWFLGCIFLAAAVFSVSLFNVIQVFNNNINHPILNHLYACYLMLRFICVCVCVCLAGRDGEKVSACDESGFILQHSRDDPMSNLLVVYGKRPKCMEDPT